MGVKKSIVLLSILVLPFIASDVFGEIDIEDSIIVETDSKEYFSGDILLISGHVEEKKMPVIAMRVFDPEGGILSANNLEIEDDNSFSRELFLDSPFYDKPGIYLIKFDYGKTNTEINFEILSDEIFDEIILDDDTTEVIILVTDQSIYQDNDFIVIAGIVSSIEDSTVLIGIYDPFGTPTGFYFADIDDSLEFSTSFLAKKGVNFKTEGTYSVVAHYAESEYAINFDFVNSIDLEISDEGSEENESESNIEIDPKPPELINDTPEKENDNNEGPELTSDDVSDNKIDHTKTKEKDKIQKINKKELEDNNSKKVYNNLSVEDIELGMMLNLITLNCDQREYIYSISYYDGMGPALMRLCNYSEAISHFDKFLIEEPTNVEVLTNKGTALSKLGLFDEAIYYFDAALTKHSNFFPALNNKANTLAESGDLEEAISLYSIAQNSNPNIPLLQKNLETTFKKLDMLERDSTNQVVTNQFNTNQVLEENPRNGITNQVDEKTISKVNEINKDPTNIIEQIGVAFSSLGSNLLGFFSN